MEKQPTTDLVIDIMYRWHEQSRLTRWAYRNMMEIAQKCADDLGFYDMPDNAISHGLIAAWLRKEPNVELRG